MFSIHASDILQHWSVTHALAVQQTSDRTLKDMKRLPPHLIDDVNARGLPQDETDQIRSARPASRSDRRLVLIK